MTVTRRLLLSLNVPLMRVRDDYNDAKELVNGVRFSVRCHTRLSAAFSRSEFLDWLSGYNSSMLIVHGNDSSRKDEDFAPLSHYAWNLLHWMEECDFALPLSYFGGVHDGRAQDDTVLGAVGLFRVLLHQLLIGYEFPNIPAFSNEALREYEAGSLGQIGKALGTLMSLLNTGKIVLVVDGAHALESMHRPDTRFDFRRVLNILQEIMDRLNGAGSRIVFKVLVMFPDSSGFTHEWFPEVRVLEVQDHTFNTLCNNTGPWLYTPDRLARDPRSRGRPVVAEQQFM